MAILSLIPIVTATVDWIRPQDLRDDFFGLLIYDGNINITSEET